MIDTQQFKHLLQKKKPDTAIILGSGLSTIADNLKDSLTIKYSEIKGFPTSTVTGHKGQMVIGTIGKHEVLCMQGRFHLYEGYHPSVIKDVIGSLKSVGITKLILTNAAGSLNSKFAPGQIMLIYDHINLSGCNPLIGPNDDKLGPRFVDMTNAYNSSMNKKIRSIAKKLNITLCEGTYLMVTGPNFETPAEIRAFRTLGADAVGMSTVPEVISAAYYGLKTIALSVITNFGAGMQIEKLSHEQTLTNASKGIKDLTNLLQSYFEEK